MPEHDPSQGTPEPIHEPGTSKGEELKGKEGRDSGVDLGEAGADRPAGSRSDPPDPSGGSST